jgi:phosphoribosylformylglycinamidine cyclo-ligase
MHNNSKSDSYAKAGVDITAGYKAVELMKKHIARTVVNSGNSDIGGFGGLFALDLTGYKNPVLVSGTDGVGTKLKLAFLMDKHDTVGMTALQCALTTLFAVAQNPYSSLTISLAVKTFLKK